MANEGRKKNFCMRVRTATSCFGSRRRSKSSGTDKCPTALLTVIPAHATEGGLSLASYAEWKQLLTQDEYVRSGAYSDWLDERWRLQQEGQLELDLQGDASDG